LINKHARKTIEDRAWEDIDEIREKNKILLADNIMEGMESKDKLTTKTGEYKSLKQEKENMSGDI
jgi:hypothetical protein